MRVHWITYCWMLGCATAPGDGASPQVSAERLDGGFLGRAPTKAAAEAPTPPVAQRKPHVEELFGETRSDDYFWLREKQNSEVRAYLEAENAYTAAMTAGSTQ